MMTNESDERHEYDGNEAEELVSPMALHSMRGV
jgi:hypothetical protein